MFGIPKDFDASIFLTKNLEAVSFSVNTISFVFDQNLLVTLEGSFQHAIDSSPAGLNEGTVPVEESRLMQLVGATVVGARAEDSKTLALDFDNGHELRFLDDSPQYESFRIQHGDAEIVV